MRKCSRALALAIVSMILIGGSGISSQSSQGERRTAWDAPHNGNPFIPGYYADASVLQANGEVFVYATEDPWGSRNLGCWHSADLEHWWTCSLNWPTKKAATSPTSNSNLVWAPSVIRGNDGRFYMYVSVGSEVWVGVADQPTGPWRNLLGNRPLIPSTFNTAYHMIDAEVFLDTDGRVYLYWGSGLNWVNGHCFAVRLNTDMASFDGVPQDVTPAHYFEAPFMYKHKGRYYLMYSQGKTTNTTYNIRYAIGDSPLGPFHEGVNSPILKTDAAENIFGPGHHAVFDRGGKTYIVYHRHALPYDADNLERQLCMDELRFRADGEIEPVVPTHTGPAILHRVLRNEGALAAHASASTSVDTIHGPARVLDDNFATVWKPVSSDRKPWLELDLGHEQSLSRAEILFGIPWKVCRFKLLASSDGQHWTVVADHSKSGEVGSPIEIDRIPSSRYLRLAFHRHKDMPLSVIEWTVYPNKASS